MACRSRLRSPGSRYEWSFLVSVDVEVQVSMVERPAVEETGRQSVHHVCGPSRDRRGRVRTVRLRSAHRGASLRRIVGIFCGLEVRLD